MKYRLSVDLTKKELEDLGVILELCYDTFDFHSDLIPMQKPIDKLDKAVKSCLEHGY